MIGDQRGQETKEVQNGGVNMDLKGVKRRFGWPMDTLTWQS